MAGRGNIDTQNGLGSTEALVVSQKGGQFELKEVQLKEMRSNEVVVRMVATGICHTDLATVHVGGSCV